MKAGHPDCLIAVIIIAIAEKQEKVWLLYLDSSPIIYYLIILEMFKD